MRSCWIPFRGGVLNLMPCHIDFCQSRSKCCRISANAGTHIVAGVFARAPGRHLNQHCSKRRQYDYCQCADGTDAAITAAAIAATKKQSKLREHGDCASNRCSHRHKQRVVILNVREFTGNNTGKLIMRKHVKQPACDRDRCIFWIATGGKCIRLRIVHYVDARHWQARAARPVSHVMTYFWCCALVDLLSPVHLQYEAVGIPISDEIGCGSYEECN